MKITAGTILKEYSDKKSIFFEKPIDIFEMPRGEVKIFKELGEKGKYRISNRNETYNSYKEAENTLIEEGFYTTENKYWGKCFKNDKLLKEEDEAKKHNEELIEKKDKITNEIRKELFNKLDTHYIRFGCLPEGGKSYNFRDKFFEKGVSCYRAIKYRNIYVIDDEVNPFTMLDYRENKQGYEITGKLLENEKGSDDEPLLTDCKIVKEIKEENIYTLKEFIYEYFQ